MFRSGPTVPTQACEYAGQAMAPVDLVLQLALGIALTAWVVRNDMRRGGPERLARSWNAASFWSAVVVFQPLSILVHFVRTRRSVLGFLTGVVWTTLVVLILSAVSWVLEGIAGTL